MKQSFQGMRGSHPLKLNISIERVCRLGHLFLITCVNNLQKKEKINNETS